MSSKVIQRRHNNSYRQMYFLNKFTCEVKQRDLIVSIIFNSLFDVTILILKKSFKTLNFWWFPGTKNGKKVEDKFIAIPLIKKGTPFIFFTVITLLLLLV